MPFFDRYWWLRLADGLFHIVLAAGLVTWLVALEITSGASADQTGILLGYGIALLTLTIGIWRAFAAMRGRRRKMARLAALAGDTTPYLRHGCACRKVSHQRL